MKVNRFGWTLYKLGQHLGVAPDVGEYRPTFPRRNGLTLTLGEAADLSGKCHVDKERARG
jgi:hypothetical protein